MENQENDSSILDRRIRGRIPLPWRSGWGPALRATAYILTLYVLVFGYAQAFAAYSCTIRVAHPAVISTISATDPGSNGASPFCSGSPVTNFPCYYSNSGTTGSVNRTTGVATGGAFFGSYNFATRCGIGLPVPGGAANKLIQRAKNASTGTYTGDQHYDYWIDSTAGTCPSGYTLVSGVCELPPDDVCAGGGGYGEPTTVMTTAESSTNPGLCAPGDFVETTSDACVESEELGPGSYCTASVDTEVEYVSDLPPKFVTTQYISFAEDSETCEDPLPPVAPSYPEDCGTPPPTCGANQVLQAGVCVTYLPPVNTYTPVTSQYPTTTNTTGTSTTTTTTNPDGSVTTVTNTTIETETEQGECPEGEKCDAAYVGPDLGDDPKTFSESLEGYRVAIDDAPILSAVGDIAGAVPESSSCPTWNVDFDLAGNNFAYTLDGHCQAMEDNDQLMRDVMAIVWSLVALFVLLSA